jgi:hypothetical protein
MVGSVLEILERLEQWGYMTHVHHIPPQEEIMWSYVWRPVWTPKNGASSPASCLTFHADKLSEMELGKSAVYKMKI